MPQGVVENFQMDYLLSEVIKRANRYLTELPTRRVSPAPDAVAELKQLDVTLQDHPIKPAAVLADDQGKMRAASMPPIAGPTIICIQAGNVNTGAFDPAEEIGLKAQAAGAWVHVEGAFGLWAAAAPKKSALATATGRCRKTVAETIPGFVPVKESNVILVGARDLDMKNSGNWSKAILI